MCPSHPLKGAISTTPEAQFSERINPGWRGEYNVDNTCSLPKKKEEKRKEVTSDNFVFTAPEKVSNLSLSPKGMVSNSLKFALKVPERVSNACEDS